MRIFWFCKLTACFLFTSSVFATTAPSAPVNLNVGAASVYPGQTVTLSWSSGTGHVAGSSDYGVYVTPPGGAQRLLHGPVAWSASKPSYSVNLQPNEGVGVYKYRVYACNYSNYCTYSDKSLTVVVPPAPTAPTSVSLAASVTMGQSTTLSWKAGSGHIAGKSTFGVYVTPPGGAQKLLHGPISWSSSQSNYQVTLTPANGTGTYQYRIYACNYDNYCSYNDKSLTVAAPTPPSAPVNLNVSAASVYPAQSVTLSWSSGTGHVTGSSDFGVYVTPPGGTQRLLQGPMSWSASKSGYSVNLQPNEGVGTYKYRVYACNYSNYCSYSDKSLTVIAPPAPAAPTNVTLAASMIIGQSTTLSWQAGSGHIAGNSNFGVYATVPGGTEKLLKGPINWVSGQNNYQVVLTPASGAGVYQYRIYACNYSNYCSNVASLITVLNTTMLAPLINPNGGTHSAPVSVTLTTLTSDAQTRYSIDGSDVTSSSALYSAPFMLSQTATVKARSFKTGMADSAQSSASFVIQSAGAVEYIYDNNGRLLRTESKN